jgi:hypothetical protein
MSAIPAAEIAAFKLSAPAPLGGNTEWAQRMGAELRRVYHVHASQAPRTLQRTLGPSELGVRCDRQVVHKMLNMAPTNHVADPWPSIRGTALHAWAQLAFDAENERLGAKRWLTERKVTPFNLNGDGPGTADLYDCWQFALLDWKFLGPTSMAKIRSPHGPPIHYQIQMILYAQGYRNLGYRVDRVVLAAMPAAASSLDGMYLWDHPYSVADDELIEQVIDRTRYRRSWAEAIMNGRTEIMNVPATPEDEVCIWCPMYRPQAARDGGSGCPGTIGHRDEIPG